MQGTTTLIQLCAFVALKYSN